MPPLPDHLHINSASLSTLVDTYTCSRALPLHLLQNTGWQASQNTTWTLVLAMSQCPIQQGKGSVTHTLCIGAGAVGLWRRLVHEMQSHKAIVLVFHIYPFFPPLQGTIGSLKDREQEAVLLCYQHAEKHEQAFLLLLLSRLHNTPSCYWQKAGKERAERASSGKEACSKGRHTLSFSQQVSDSTTCGCLFAKAGRNLC